MFDLESFIVEISHFHKIRFYLTFYLSPTILPCRLSWSCRERWNDGCAHGGQNAELNTVIDKRGKENMGMERLIASCEDYRELGINWQESDDDRLKEEMKKQRCSSLLPLNLSSSYLTISLLAS